MSRKAELVETKNAAETSDVTVLDYDNMSITELEGCMSPALRKEAAAIDKLFGIKNSIINRYEIGKRILVIRSDAAKYGLKAIQQLSAFFGCGRDTLYAAEDFATNFTKDDVDELIEMKMSKGTPVLLTHLLTLSRVKNPSSRKELLNLTLTNNWNPKQLSSEIKQRMSPQHNPTTEKRGRPPVRPKTLNGYVEQFLASSATWLNLLHKHWTDDEGLLEAFNTAPPRERVPSMAERLRTAASVARDISQGAESLARDFEKFAKELGRNKGGE